MWTAGVCAGLLGVWIPDTPVLSGHVACSAAPSANLSSQPSDWNVFTPLAMLESLRYFCLLGWQCGTDPTGDACLPAASCWLRRLWRFVGPMEAVTMVQCYMPAQFSLSGEALIGSPTCAWQLWPPAADASQRPQGDAPAKKTHAGQCWQGWQPLPVPGRHQAHHIFENGPLRPPASPAWLRAPSLLSATTEHRDLAAARCLAWPQNSMAAGQTCGRGSARHPPSPLNASPQT